MKLREPKKLTQLLPVKKGRDQDLNPNTSSNDMQHVLSSVPYGLSSMLIYFHLLLLHHIFLTNNDFDITTV